MEITVNNQPYQFEASTTVMDVLEKLGLEGKTGIAVAVNEQIISHGEWQNTILNNEDKIILIGAVAGG
ncbi:MAG: sulfur carrier protein ThiS [Sphingobacteriales bacterium]|nr:sulfur carrier protein ThiS [Sphingobacteriales bacterium]